MDKKTEGTERFSNLLKATQQLQDKFKIRSQAAWLQSPILHLCAPICPVGTTWKGTQGREAIAKFWNLDPAQGEKGRGAEEAKSRSTEVWVGVKMRDRNYRPVTTAQAAYPDARGVRRGGQVDGRGPGLERPRMPCCRLSASPEDPRKSRTKSYYPIRRRP